MATHKVDWSFLYRSEPSDRWTSHFTLMVWKAFRPFIKTGSRLLEIGCGPAAIVSRSVLELGCAGVASDIDPAALQYAGLLAEKVGARVQRVLGDGLCLPFQSGTFDAVLSAGVIEHFSRAETALMVAEHARVCRAGGRVLIAVPNLLNLPLTYHKLRTGPSYHAYPERSYTVWGLARLMRGCGLRPVAWSGFGPAIGLEWFIHSSLRLRWIDRHAPNWLLALFGHEVLVAAEKAG